MNEIISIIVEEIKNRKIKTELQEKQKMKIENQEMKIENRKSRHQNQSARD